MAIATQSTRELALAACQAGKLSFGDIAATFNIHRDTLWIWRKQHQQGITAPKPRGHTPAKFQGELLDELDTFVAEHSDATLEDIKDHFTGRVDCSIVTISNTLKRLRWAFKKRRYTRVSRTETM